MASTQPPETQASAHGSHPRRPCHDPRLPGDLHELGRPAGARHQRVGRHQRQAAPGQGDLGRPRHLLGRPALRERRRRAVLKKQLPPDLQPVSVPARRRGARVRHAGRPAGVPVAADADGLGGRQPDRAHPAGLDPEGQQRGRSRPERQGHPRPAPDRPPAGRPDRAEETGAAAIQKGESQGSSSRTSRSSRSPTRSNSTPRGRSPSSSRGSPGSSRSAAGPLRPRRLSGGGAAAGWSCSATASA